MGVLGSSPLLLLAILCLNVQNVDAYCPWCYQLIGPCCTFVGVIIGVSIGVWRYKKVKQMRIEQRRRQQEAGFAPPYAGTTGPCCSTGRYNPPANSKLPGSQLPSYPPPANMMTPGAQPPPYSQTGAPYSNDMKEANSTVPPPPADPYATVYSNPASTKY